MRGITEESKNRNRKTCFFTIDDSFEIYPRSGYLNSAFHIPNSEFIIAPGGERRPGYIPARERVFRGERILLSIDRQYG